MTRHHQHRRLQRLLDAMRHWPPPPEVVGQAFERFRSEGTLPDDDEVARVVLERAKHGFEIDRARDPRVDRDALFAAAMRGMERPRDPELHDLYRHAMDANPAVRAAARKALIDLAATGRDPTEPRGTP